MGSKYRGKAPISENSSKVKEVSDEECLEELRRVVLLFPDRVITRNFFRINSTIAESVWSCRFGTFEEFKRQAGVKLSRQQHQLEKQIAKHVSVDQYKELNKERTNWGERYISRNTTRYQTILFAADFHDTESDPFSLAVLIDTARRLKPDVISLVGDLFDLPEFGRYTVDPRSWDVVGRIRFVHEYILAPLRKAAPNAQIDLLEGNHEFRLLRHLCDATPALKAVLSDLHGFTISKLLGLERFEINYVAKCDLATYNLSNQKDELQKNYRIYFNAVLAHHYPAGSALGMPGVNSHHHKLEVRSLYNETFKAYNWIQMSGIHRRNASYTMGEKWTNGFVIAHVDTETRQTIFEPISIGDFTCVGGKYLYRDKK